MGEFIENTIGFILLFVGGLILILSIYGLFLFVGVNWQTGEGVSTDYVMGVDQNGVIWKTYDVYLRNEHPTERNVGRYCIPQELVDNGQIEFVKLAAQNNGKCSLYYKTMMAVYPWRCNEGNAIITKIKCEPNNTTEVSS